jgi:hypothetical protein
MIRKYGQGGRLIGLASRTVLFLDTIQGNFRSIVTYGTLTGDETIAIGTVPVYPSVVYSFKLSFVSPKRILRDRNLFNTMSVTCKIMRADFIINVVLSLV